MKKSLLIFLLCVIGFSLQGCEELVTESPAWDNLYDQNGVGWHPPVVQLMRDTTGLPINDTLWLRASASDANGEVVYYHWSEDGGVSWMDTTEDSTRAFVWSDSGSYSVWVRVEDDDGVLSEVDSVKIGVQLYAPVVDVMGDTVLSQNQTLVFTVSATDENGSIVQYLLDTDGDGVWEDSSASGEFGLSHAAGGWLYPVWAARDDDGVLTRDTFEVLFNRPPAFDSLQVLNWSSWDDATGTGTLQVQIHASDGDGAGDTLQYRLEISSESIDVEGRDSLKSLSGLDSNGRYDYRAVVRDLYGDSAVFTGTIFAPPSPCSELGAGIRDSRDGQQYACVIIGTQTWMAENLNYYVGNGSYCYDDDLYDNDPVNCDTYGRLYTWDAAMGGAAYQQHKS
jgi:hypothetical protein